MGLFEDAINQALNESPELQQMPGVAVAAAQSADPANDSQALAGVAQAAAATDAYQQVKKRHGWLDEAIGDLGGAIGAVSKFGGKVVGQAVNNANKPLQVVQHEYRYVRDVYKQKGVGAGLAESLGVAAGAAAGGYLTDSSQGAMLGGELAGAALGQVTYRDVWKSSDTSGGSIGRDITRNVGLGGNLWTSAVLDGVSDLLLDPVALTVGMSGGARSAKGLGGVLKGVAPGTAIRTLDGVDAARASAVTGRYYEHALKQLAGMGEADVGHYFPKLAPIADRIGAASTTDEVHQVFRDVARDRELLGSTDTLPSLTLTQQALQVVRHGALDNAPGGVDRFILRPFSKEAAGWDAEFKNFSNRQFDVTDPGATEIVRRLVRYGETNRVATDVADAFAAETDPGRRLEIFHNAIYDSLLARAKVDPNTADPNFLRKLRSSISDLTTFGEGTYGNNMDGVDISKVLTSDEGVERSAGIRQNQIGKTAIPNFVAFKRTSQMIAGYNKIFGEEIAKGLDTEAAGALADAGVKVPKRAAMDDWIYDHATAGLFKPLVTLSGGFGERIALSEAIPQILRNGFLKTVQATAASHFAELGIKVADEDTNRIGKAVYAALGGDEGKIANSEAVQIATKQILSSDGDTIPNAINAGHAGGMMDLSPRESKVIDLRKQIQTNAKIQEKYGDDFQLFARGEGDDKLRIDRWRANLKEAAQDPATRSAAQAADSVLAAGGTIDDARNAGAMAASKFIRENPDMYDGRFVRFDNAHVDGDWADHWGRVSSEAMFGDVGYKIAPTGPADLPPVKDGFVRLFRGEGTDAAGNHLDTSAFTGFAPGRAASAGQWFSDTPETAEHFGVGRHGANSRHFYVDIPAEDAARFDTTRLPADEMHRIHGTTAVKGEYLLDHEAAAKAIPYDVHPPSVEDSKKVIEDFLNRPDIVAKAAEQGTHEEYWRNFLDANGHLPADMAHLDLKSLAYNIQTKYPDVMDTSRGLPGQVRRLTRPTEPYGVHRNLLHSVAYAKDDATLASELDTGHLSKAGLAEIPIDQTPLAVKGRITVSPDTLGTVQRIADVGHRKFITPIINTLGREPIYNTEFAKQYKGLQQLADDGLIDDAQRVMEAQKRTSSAILPYVHNTTERSQLGYTVRNFMPFYFAQEQAYQRAGRLLAEDPAAFRRYQLMMTGLANVGFPTSDSRGKGFLAFPGTGFLTAGAVALAHRFGVPIAGSVPTGLSGNLTSLNTVFPFVEDPIPWHKPGPMVSIPLKALENLRPEIGPITDAVIGNQATAGSMWDQIIPNQFIKNALKAMGARGLTTSQYNSTLAIMQQLGDQGQLPDPKDEMAMQAFVDRAKNQSRILDITKALFSLVSPAAPQVDIRGQFTDLLNQYVTKYGNVPLAIQKLTEDHPDATARTVFHTTGALGQNVPAFEDAQAWISANPDLIHKYPQAAAYLVPQHKGDTFSQSVYNEQIAQHFRTRKAPLDFLKDIYTAAGNAQFFGHDLPAHQAALNDLVASGNDAGATAERQSFQQYINQDYGPKNPVWWAHLKQDNTQRKQQGIAGLVEIFAKGLAPDNEQSHDVAGLLSDYASHIAALRPGVGSALAQADRLAETNHWDQYLHQLAAQKPNLVPIINGLFRDTGEKPLVEAV